MIKREEALSWLELPLSWTFYDETAVDRGIPGDELEKLISSYESSRMESFVSALRWASENPQERFSSILPNMLYEDAQLHAYLSLLYEQFAEAVRRR